jgi:ABC-type nickel/cobalt efflux system permease component RcnA/high-affinity nickel permease
MKALSFHTGPGTASNRRNGTRILTLAACLLTTAAPCFGHPMGNFSINHYSKLSAGRKSIQVKYLIDMAEIPTFQEMRQFNLRPEPESAEVERYLAVLEDKLASGLSLRIDERPVRLASRSRRVRFSEGAGGLSTMKIELVLRGDIDASPAPRNLVWADRNFAERAGWKEVVVVADGVRLLNTSAPATDRSSELTNYSSDSVASPPQDLTAEVTFQSVDQPGPLTGALPKARKTDPGQGAPGIETLSSTPATRESAKLPAAPAPAPGRETTTFKGAPGPDPVQAPNTPRNRFTELISTQSDLSFWVLLSAGLIAAGLGALHALEPGHGKTIVAAYLVGSRGTAGHAGLLGLVVTASHMAGVYLLGIATLYASRYIVPDQLYPWLGTISGLSVAGIGIVVFLRHWAGESGDHSHASGENHSHWFSSQTKATANPGEVASCGEPTKRERPLSLRELCILGITGGIVPCPAALVVLLSAFSLHRICFGLFLITAFSAGLAFVLVLAGLVVVYAKRAMSSRLRAENRIVRNLPLLSSAFMIAMGIGLVLSSGVSSSVWQEFHFADRLVPFVGVVLIGLFLGIRHSTDPDHVVAVSTIVTQQGTVGSSASIGLLWGLGHTITIFIVGSAIIVFRMVIPPRLGLSMEFCVACMLILLGLVNMTRTKRSVTDQPRVAGTDPRLPDDLRGSSGLPSSGRVARIRAKHFRGLSVYQTLRPLVVGLIHGLAGSAAVALLVLSTIKSPLWSTAYLLVFGFGTMLGMMLMTTAMSLPMIYAGRRFFRFNHWLVALSGAASVAFGVFLVYQIGFVDGLFTSNVHWTPQ